MAWSFWSQRRLIFTFTRKLREAMSSWLIKNRVSFGGAYWNLDLVAGSRVIRRRRRYRRRYSVVYIDTWSPTGLDSANPELAMVVGQRFGHLQIWSPGDRRPYGYTSKLSNIGRQTRGFARPRIVVTLEWIKTDATPHRPPDTPVLAMLSFNKLLSYSVPCETLYHINK